MPEEQSVFMLAESVGVEKYAPIKVKWCCPKGASAKNW